MTDDARRLLREARDKLRIYRAHHSGEYLGGREYNALISEIDAYIASPAESVMFPPDDWTDEVMAVIGLKCSFAEETRDEIERRLRHSRHASPPEGDVVEQVIEARAKGKRR